MSQFSPTENCTNLTTHELDTINLTYSITGGVCSITLLAITSLLLLRKQSNTLLKRLFLYVMIATTLREFALTASIEHHFKYSKQEKACIWIAYVFDWAGILLGVFMIGLMSYLVYLVRFLYKGKAISTPQFLQSNYRRITLEIMYVVLLPLLLFAYASIPYLNGTYGLTGARCWIQILDESCKLTTLGFVDQFSNGYVLYFIHGMAVLILTVSIVVTYLRISTSLVEARLLLKQTLFVLICLLVRILVILLAFVHEIYVQSTGYHQPMAIWLFIAVIYPSSLLLFPFGFLLCFYSRSSCLMKMPRSCKCTKKGHVVLKPFTESAQSSTFRVSTRISPPSDTFFTAPYTDGFTDLSYGSTAILVRGVNAYS